MLANMLPEHNITMNLLLSNTTWRGISKYHFTEKIMKFHRFNNVTHNSKFLILVDQTNNSNKLFIWSYNLQVNSVFVVIWCFFINTVKQEKKNNYIIQVILLRSWRNQTNYHESSIRCTLPFDYASAMQLDKTRIIRYKGVMSNIIIIKINIARSQPFITTLKKFHVNEKAHLLNRQFHSFRK